MLVGMTRHDLDRLRRLNESEESIDSRLSLDEVEAQMSMDGRLIGSWTDAIFGTPEIQKASKSGEVTDAREDAQDVPIMNDTASKEALRRDLMMRTVLRMRMVSSEQQLNQMMK